MRSSCFRIAWVIALFFSFSSITSAQFVSGQIIRACASATGRNVLDPNNSTDGSTNDYTSKLISGFGTTGTIPDVDNSELPYKPLPPFALEPYSDLRRGPSHLFSDYVPDVNGGAYYMHYDGTNFLFRLRMGTIIPGAKGYSLLFDTDGKFGATGANADPNYIAATTGTGGNPGFEIEIVLCTGGGSDGILVYNVDGTDNPTTPAATLSGWLNYSQISIAATADNGDPDFLLDFYVPTTVFTNNLGLNLSTTRLRVIPTTVMAPKGAIGGPKSDIYGLDDNLYKNPNTEYEVLLGAQPGTLISDWGGTGTTTPVKQCTAPPTISNSSLTAGNVTITGSWTKSTLTGTEQNTTAIKVYRIPSGSTTASVVATIPNVANGTNWSTATVTPSIAVSAGDIIYATAVATNESECLRSNIFQVLPICNSSNKPAIPVLTCTTTAKGLGGTNLQTGWTVYVENMSNNTSNNSDINTGSLFSTPTGTSPNLAWMYSDGCSGGKQLDPGSYKVYYRDNVTGCISEPAYVCAAGNGNGSLAGSLAVPTITSPVNSNFTTATSVITGTSEVNAKVSLYVDGVLSQTITATTGGAFTFSNVKLNSGQKVYITTELNTGAVATSKCAAKTATATVSCFTTSPVITTTAGGTLTAGKPILGTSTEPVGTVIRVYSSANTTTPVATTTVKSDGTWSTGNTPETTPAVYNAVGGTIYYATAQNGTCALSASTANVTTLAAASTTRCASVTVTTPLPINSSVTSLTGGITGNATTTKVNIYQDGNLIGSSTNFTTATTWTATGLSLYSGNGSTTGIITLGVQETGKEEEVCSNRYTVIPSGCTTPTIGALTITPESQTIVAGHPATFTFNSPSNGMFYSVVDQTTGGGLSNGIWSTGANFSIITKPLSTNTTAIVRGAIMAANGESCSAPLANRAVTIATPLPIHLLEFKGVYKEGTNVLLWKTALEDNASHFEVERSTDGTQFSKIGTVGMKGTGYAYTFVDNRVQAGINYYRLKMIDLDDSYIYSRIITIRNGDVLPSTNMWPNPFKNEINLEVFLKEGSSITISLLNESGNQVMVKQINGHKGINNIKFTPVKSLAPSVYILQIQTNEGIKQQKLIRISN
jgi:hypothetical protein